MQGRADLIQCYQEYYEDLIQFLLRRVGGMELASELAHDTYLRLTKVSDTTEIKDTRAYIFKIAANLVIDRGRADNRIKARRDLDTDMEDLHDPLPSAERVTDARQHLNHLEAALSGLSENQRKALLMNLVEGRTHGEIAKKLGVSASMVAKYLHEAVAVCRDRLRELDQEQK